MRGDPGRKGGVGAIDVTFYHGDVLVGTGGDWKIVKLFSERGGEHNLKLMMKCSFALHRQRACVAGEWSWTVGGEVD